MPEQTPFNLEQTVDQLRDSGLSPEEIYGELADVPEFQMEVQKRGMKSSRQTRDLIETRFAEQKAMKQAQKYEEDNFTKMRKALGAFQKKGMGRVQSNVEGLIGALGDLPGAKDAEAARSDERVKWIDDDLKKGNYGKAALNGLKSVPMLGGAFEDTLKNIVEGNGGNLAGDAVTALLTGGLKKGGMKSSARGSGSIFPPGAAAIGKRGVEAGLLRFPILGRMAKAAKEAMDEEKTAQAQQARDMASPENPIPPMDPEAMMQAQQQAKMASPMPNQGARPAQPPSAGMDRMSGVEQQLWERMQQEAPKQSPFPQLPIDRGLNRLSTQEGLNRPMGPRSTGMAAATPEQMSAFEQLQSQAQPSPFPQLPKGRGMFDLATQEKLAKQKPPLFSGFGKMTPAQKGHWTKIQKKMAQVAAEAAEAAREAEE